MEFSKPSNSGFTVYSKSGCIYCTNVKKLIKETNLFPFTEVNCDEYLLKDREGFLKFIEVNAQTSYKTFPMVFLNGKFIGGYTHTKQFIGELISAF